VIVLDSARKHGISEREMKKVIVDALVVAKLRDEPAKYLFLGFDSNARAIEVITDIGHDGTKYIIHADKITKNNEKLLKEGM
jgi:hypothetical protein